jgi:hypothetical protein
LKIAFGFCNLSQGYFCSMMLIEKEEWIKEAEGDE